MKKIFSFDFANQSLNDFTNFLIDFLVLTIRELNHVMRSYFNEKKENRLISL